MHPSNEVTRLLGEWSRGDRGALDRLLPMVHRELHQIAARLLHRESDPARTLQPTVLVNELYLKLVGQSGVTWQDRAHFFALSSKYIRQILVDHARAGRTAKRGGARTMVSVEEVDLPSRDGQLDLLALDEALERLEQVDPDLMRIVELRFFAGLSVEETAEVLGSSAATVKRDWSLARAWLRKALE